VSIIITVSEKINETAGQIAFKRFPLILFVGRKSDSTFRHAAIRCLVGKMSDYALLIQRADNSTTAPVEAFAHLAEKVQPGFAIGIGKLDSLALIAARSDVL